MRGHAATDLRLLADDHALQHAGVAEAEIARDGRGRGRQGGGAEGRRQRVQVVADLVDGEGLRLGERPRGGVEGVFLEEEADFVARGEEVAVGDVGGGLAGGEAREGVRGEREGGEEVLRFGEEGGGGGGGEEGGEEEVAVCGEGGELGGGEAEGFGWGRRGWGGARGGHGWSGDGGK